MTPIRETIARAAMDARVHDLAPNVGDLIVGSEFVQSCFGDDGDDGPFFRSAYGLTIAKAVLRALDEAGLAVVPREPTEAMQVAGAAISHDLSGQIGRPTDKHPVTAEAYRAMISASVVE